MAETTPLWRRDFNVIKPKDRIHQPKPHRSPRRPLSGWNFQPPKAWTACLFELTRLSLCISKLLTQKKTQNHDFHSIFQKDSLFYSMASFILCHSFLVYCAAALFLNKHGLQRLLIRENHVFPRRLSFKRQYPKESSNNSPQQHNQPNSTLHVEWHVPAACL